MNRLKREGLLVDRDGLGLDCPVLQLSKKGFDYLKFDLGELREKRYAAQSVAHDYWASVFQLGEFIQNQSTHVELFTEQEIQCTDDSLLPRWVPKFRDHIPDGMTLIRNGETEAVIATEVELNLKPLLRYDKAGHYFDTSFSKNDIVFWLCANTNIAQHILNRLFGMKLRNFDIHNFVLTSDFKELGWESSVRAGSYKSKSIKDVYVSKGYPKPSCSLSLSYPQRLRPVFFPVVNSPRPLRT
jgi:hypothetical protein